MKNILLLILTFIMLNNLNAQTYHVIQVNGTIKNESTNTFLVSGDIINANDKIAFEDKDSKAALISGTEGLMTLQALKTITGYKLIDDVYSNLYSEEGRLSSGYIPPSLESFTAKPLENLYEIQSHFGRENYLILNNSANVEVDAKDFPTTNSSYFMLKYDYSGLTIYKQLEYSSNTILLDFNKIFEVNNELISETMAFNYEVYYHKGKKISPLKICNFDPIFVQNAEIMPKVKIIKDVIEDKEKFTQEVYNYLTDYYGSIYIPNLKKWLSDNFEI